MSDEIRPPLRPGSQGEYKTPFNRMAFSKGYRAAMDGKAADAVQHPAWQAGWKQYQTDRERQEKGLPLQTTVTHRTRRDTARERE